MAQGHKLTYGEQMEILKLIASSWRQRDIAKHIFETTGRKIARQLVSFYLRSEKWKPIIEKLKEDYHKACFEVPLYHKRKRLDELQRHYEHHMDDAKWQRAQEVLKDIKDEVEAKYGDVSFHFTQVTNTQYADMNDEQLAEERKKTFEQLERAQRMKKLLESKNVKEDSTNGQG